jgi:PAS domain S-box-containing protein
MQHTAGKASSDRLPNAADDEPSSAHDEPVAGYDVRHFHALGVVMSLLSAALFAAFANPVTAATYHPLALGSLCVAGVFAVAGWHARRQHVLVAVRLALWSGIGLLCLTTLGMDEGIHAVALGFFAVLTCVATIVLGLRAGIAMGLFCLCWVFGLVAAELAGWVRGAAAVPASPFAMRLLTLLMMVSLSWGVGLVLARLMEARLQAVRTRGQRARSLFEQSPVAMLLHRDGMLLDGNRVAAALLGLPPESRGVDVSSLQDGRGAQALRAVLAHAAVLDGAAVGAALPRASLVVRAPGGRDDEHVLQVSAIRVAVEGGDATLSIVFDDTERARAEAEARRAETLLVELLAASPDCIALTRGDGEVLLVNGRLAAMVGCAPADVTGRVFSDLGLWLHEAERQRFRAQLAARGYVRNAPATFITRDGEVREFALSANALVIDGEVHSVAISRDVTEHERARRELQATLDTAALGIALTRNAVITRVNGAFNEIFGHAPGSVPGMQAWGLWWSPEEGPLRIAECTPALQRGELVDFESEMRRADGARIWCRLRSRAIDPAHVFEGGLVWLVEDVTERRAIARALEAARDAAEAASRAKSAFLASTSHEIRTPLNGVVGLARLALRADIDEPTRTRHLRQIVESADNLAEIMGGILDMSKIEAGELTLDVAPFDLHALCTALHATYAPVAEGRGLDCTLDIAASVPRVVLGDATRLRQVLGNYVTNALKFTQRGGVHIELGVVAGGRVRFAVRDTGIGIDAPTLARLFRPFAQADAATTRNFGGTGLGLSICRELATLMGGEVGATSERGKGSVFWAELPLPASHDALPARVPTLAPQPAPQIALPIAVYTNVAAADARSLDGVRVLLAEDNPVNRIIATALLQDWRLQVTEADDGQAAVEAIDAAARRGEPFGLVLMDVQMPRLDGFAATRALRARYSPAELPIVALTAGVLHDERAAALAAGMDAFVSKPFDERVLQQTLVEVLARAHLNAAAVRAGA